MLSEMFWFFQKNVKDVIIKKVSYESFSSMSSIVEHRSDQVTFGIALSKKMSRL